MDEPERVCEECPTGPHVCRLCARSCCNHHFTLSAALADAEPFLRTGVGRLAVGLPPSPDGAEFVVYLVDGLVDHYPVRTELGGDPMRGGAAEAYRAAWIGPLHVCVFCRERLAQTAALMWMREYEMGVAVELALAAQAEEEAARERALADERERVEAERVRLVHEAHVARVSTELPSEAQLLADRELLNAELARVRRVGGTAWRGRGRLQRGTFQPWLVVRAGLLVAVVQVVILVAVRLAFDRTLGWSMVELMGITLVTSVLVWWFVRASVRRRVLTRAAPTDGPVPPPKTVLRVAAVAALVGAAVLMTKLLLGGVSSLIGLGLMAVAEAVVAVAAVTPVMNALTELRAAEQAHAVTVRQLRSRLADLDGALARYRCGEPGCAFDRAGG